VGVKKVEFHLTGGSLNNALIATGTLSNYGWYAYWNSTTVPDGTYTLQSDAYAASQGVSTAETIIVANSPVTSILKPSNGASVSGSQVLLDAGASENGGVAKVSFYLTGGSLNNALIATAIPSYYGWYAYWNSTTVPDGTYTLQSDADDGAGNQGVSSSISVTVAN
jgi:major membrane immunogen (membrane-anchored lipoprotein)